MLRDNVDTFSGHIDCCLVPFVLPRVSCRTYWAGCYLILESVIKKRVQEHFLCLFYADRSAAIGFTVQLEMEKREMIKEKGDDERINPN